MSEQNVFDRILVSLHEAMLDDVHWPATAALIDGACGATGNELVVAEGFGADVDILWARFCYRGQRREDLEREYFEVYHPQDERLPRLRQLQDSRVVHVTDLYTEEELGTSVTYNEWLRRSGAQNALYVRMDGPHGTRIVWAIADPIEAGGWRAGQIEMIERLLPPIRQFVQIREALASAEALGASLAGLLDNTRVGVVQLDRRGRIAAANDRARDILRQGDGLSDQGGFLRAWLPADDVGLQQQLADALPTSGGAAASGSIALRNPNSPARLVLHVNPVGAHETSLGARRVAALVLIVEPRSQPSIDPDFVAAALGLTPAESQVATFLAEGGTVHDIAAMTSRRESTVRWLVKQIYNKQGISRQADLVRLILSIAEFAPPRRPDGH